MQVLERKPDLSPKIYREPPLLPGLRERLDKQFMPHWNTQWGGKCILHGRNPGPDSIRLDGNDYLNISGHPEIVSAQIATLRRDNDSVIQSGAFLLDAHPSRRLEASMAAWIGKEDGFICQSGYAANVGLLQAIADEKTPVYLDTLAHTSLWEGVRAARAPAHPFRHNDPAHLSRMIARNGPGVVVVDSVYSTTGALCPLVEMVEVAEQHGCTILVDESHSLGTHGPQGAGLCAELGLVDRVHFITASLAKAFAGRAGFFTVPAELRYYVLHHSYPNIFSSCLLPHEIAGLAATLDVIRASDEARERLHINTQRLRASLSDMGYPIHQGSQQIISLEAGTEPDTMVLRDRLEERQLFGAIFCAPATSRNRAMVRLTLNAGLTASELDRIEKVAREVAPLVKPWDWPIARRARAGQAEI
ncbi:alpha-hydroxyketone-type quorum-sensing autoinducer synthase [Polaromonas sp. JS666]|uniref:alpha-hydroxyketone-type quorum-sensing autoinducer synthase n=1 Tax=Polaromonas sp. (strain JS666 / ATCC BAA-500) TaxID=296591 RepID=UPI0000464410|nr:alpha-hydroxyketone-type quorum-sensing autoinducer synthase [Polaromonas sp. JS666]ABE45941.1 Glycine C-acetyltransferase [Polaromonas sp. JS666]UUZ71812.1 quorum-sensing autoinducer CAI-1 synthase [Polaromonas sp. P1(28)-8]